MATPFSSFNASALGAFRQSTLKARGGGVRPGTWVALRVASPNHRVIISSTEPPASWAVTVNSGTTGTTLFAVFAGRFIFQNFSSAIGTPGTETNHSGITAYPTGATPLIVGNTLWTASGGSTGGLYYTTDGINYTLAMSNANWASAAGVTGLSGYSNFNSPGQIYWINGAFWTIATYRRTVSGVLHTFYVVMTSSNGTTWSAVGSTGLFQDYALATLYKSTYSGTYPKIAAYSTVTALTRWEYSGGWSSVSSATVTAFISGRVLRLSSGRQISLEDGQFSDDEFANLTSYSSAGFPRGLVIDNKVYKIVTTTLQKSADEGSTFANHGVGFGESPTSFNNPSAVYYR